MEYTFYYKISEFAKNHALNDWDWLALIISIVALVIASITLIVAIKTLHSQQATQDNTAPIITMKVQKKLWLYLIKQLYYKLQYLHVLQIQLQRCNYKKKPEESFIQSFCIIPESYIHEELFYDDDDNYGDVNWLKKHIMEYNMYFRSATSHLNQRNIKPEIIDRMFFFINDACQHALKYYCSIFRKEYKDDNNEFMNYFEDELFKNQRNKIEEKGSKDFPFGEYITKDEEYSRKDGFVDFFGNNDEEFKRRYYNTTNRYMEYLLSSGKIVLVDD